MKCAEVGRVCHLHAQPFSGVFPAWPLPLPKPFPYLVSLCTAATAFCSTLPNSLSRCSLLPLRSAIHCLIILSRCSLLSLRSAVQPPDTQQLQQARGGWATVQTGHFCVCLSHGIYACDRNSYLLHPRRHRSAVTASQAGYDLHPVIGLP